MPAPDSTERDNSHSSDVAVSSGNDRESKDREKKRRYSERGVHGGVSARTTDGRIFRDESIRPAFFRSVGQRTQRNRRYRNLPMSGCNGHGVPQASECNRHAPLRIRLDGCTNRCRRRLSRIDGWKASGDFRIKKLVTGAIRTLHPTSISNGNCAEDAGSKRLADDGITLRTLSAF